MCSIQMVPMSAFARMIAFLITFLSCFIFFFQSSFSSPSRAAIEIFSTVIWWRLLNSLMKYTARVRMSRGRSLRAGSVMNPEKNSNNRVEN